MIYYIMTKKNGPVLPVSIDKPQTAMSILLHTMYPPNEDLDEVPTIFGHEIFAIYFQNEQQWDADSRVFSNSDVYKNLEIRDKYIITEWKKDERSV